MAKERKGGPRNAASGDDDSRRDGRGGGGPWLLLRTRHGEEERFPLGDDVFSIGRRSNNDLQLQESTVSREHARVVWQEGQYWIEDLGSTHGTYVGDQRVERRILHHGDVIRMGSDGGSVMVFLERDDAAAARSFSPGEVDEMSRIWESTTVAFGPHLTKADRRAGQYRALLEISRALSSSLELEEVLEKVMQAVMVLTGADRGLLMLGEDSEHLEIAIQEEKTSTSTAGGGDYSHSIVREVFTTGKPQVIRDVLEHSEFGEAASVIDLELRSVMCVPLPGTARRRPGPATGREASRDPSERDPTEEQREGDPGADIIGVVYVDRDSPIEDFTEDDLELFESLASSAAVAIENARLHEEAIEKRRLERDLEMARRIQQTLLRSTVPEISWLEIHAYNEPSRGVAGDYYEIVSNADGSVVFAIGDVSGKGMPAAFLMATLQSAFLAAILSQPDLGHVCASVNEFLFERTEPEHYATFFAGRIEPSDGTGSLRLTYVNAGHNPPYLLRGKEASELRGGGLPLGMIPDRPYRPQRLELRPGDLLVCYTDGVTEALSPAGDEFGADRLLQAVRDVQESTAEEITETLLQAVDRHVGEGSGKFDDVTLLALRL